MPEKKFNTQATIYSSDENGLGAYLSGAKEQGVTLGITDVTIPLAFTKGAMIGDIVDVNVYVKTPKKRQRAVFTNAYTGRAKYHVNNSAQGYATVQSIISPKEFTLAGKLEEGNVHNMFVAGSGSTLRAPVFNADLNGAQIGDIVLALISRKPNGTIRASILEVIGEDGNFKTSYKSELLNGGLAAGFSEGALQEAEIAASKSNADLLEGKGKDLRSRSLFTLASDGVMPTKAYSFERLEEGFRLGVYYSDASLYTNGNSELENDLFSRFASYSLLDGDFKLFPETLRNKFYLKAGEDKSVFAIIMELDSKGECTGISLENAIVNVSANGTTTEVNELFSNIDKTKTMKLSAKYSTITNEIWTMFDICAVLSQDKTYEFCQLKDVNNKKYTFAGDSITGFEYTSMNDIDMMLNIIDTLVGVSLSKYVNDNAIPFLFESQLPPSYESLITLPHLDTPLVVDETTICRLLFMYNFVLNPNTDRKVRAASVVMKNVLPTPTQTTSPGAHFTLSRFGFVNFTNPCESYIDLTLLRILKAHLEGSSTEELTDMRQKALVSAKINGLRKKNALDRIEKQINESLAEKNGNMPLSAIVTMVSQEGAEVLLPNNAYGFIPLSSITGGNYNRSQRSIEIGSTKLTFGTQIKAIRDNFTEYVDKDGTLVKILYKFVR